MMAAKETEPLRLIIVNVRGYETDHKVERHSRLRIKAEAAQSGREVEIPRRRVRGEHFPRQRIVVLPNAPTAALTRFVGMGDMVAAVFGHRKSGSHQALRWRKQDSNPRSLIRRATLSRADCVQPRRARVFGTATPYP